MNATGPIVIREGDDVERGSGHSMSHAPFCAISYFDEYFPPKGKAGVRTLYGDVFNTVKTVTIPWDSEAVNRRFKELEERKLPVAVALFDNRADANKRIVGGFFATISAGVNGPYLSAPDIFIHPDYQNLGLATELALYGREHANYICRTKFRAIGQERDVAVNLSETYKPSGLEFEPESWYKNLGYEITPMYHAATRELCNRVRGGTIEGIRIISFKQLKSEHPSVYVSLQSFLTDPANKSSDGSSFCDGNADFFQKYLTNYNGTIVRLAINADNQIVGLVSGEVMPRRSGASLIDTHCVISHQFISQHGANGISQLTGQLFAQAIEGGNATVEDRHGIILSELEFSGRSYEFYKAHLFSGTNASLLRESTEFVAMFGKQDTIIRNLQANLRNHNAKQGRTSGLVYPMLAH